MNKIIIGLMLGCVLLVSPALAKTTQPRITIVVDPGHGGKDPGAVGVYGTKEKAVVLAVAQKLVALINKQSHMKAILTRSSDHYVSLATRLKTVRKNKPELFISLHADSYFNNRADGISVYALSSHGATTLAARWLAIRENHSELGGIDLRELPDQSPQLRSVLIDLAQTATTTSSLRLGGTLLSSLNLVAPLHYSHVEQAPFMVLKSPDIPSILIEVGFLSNSNEEKKLRDVAYQDKLAKAIFNGIQHYIKKYSTVNLTSNTKNKIKYTYDSNSKIKFIVS